MSNPRLKSNVSIGGPKVKNSHPFRDIAVGSFFYICNTIKDQRLSQKVARYRDEDRVLNERLIRRSVVATGELSILNPDCMVQLVNLDIQVNKQPEDPDEWKAWLENCTQTQPKPSNFKWVDRNPF